MTELRNWVKENSALVAFLAAQLVAVATAGVWIVSYYVRMETRLEILETRGAPFTIQKLNKIEERLVVLEQRQLRNEKTIDNIVEIITKELKR